MSKKENTNEKSLLKTNVFMNGDSMKLLKQLPDNSIDYIITSPPYNYTCSFRIGRPKNGIQKRDNMYDSFNINLSSAQYCQWTVKLFKQFDRVLKKGGIILYNFSYSAKAPMLPEDMLTSVNKKTSFTKIDTITWIKDKANPISRSNVLVQRLGEYIYVMMRKGERFLAKTNRQISSYGPNGEIYYKQLPNYIIAPYGEKVRGLNNATFSVELIDQLLDAYVKDNATVLDPFMGVGTTAVSCIKAKRNIDFIGMELSKKQVDYSYKRVKDECGINLLQNWTNGKKRNASVRSKTRQKYSQAQLRAYANSSFVMKLASYIYQMYKNEYQITWGEAIKTAWTLFKSTSVFKSKVNTLRAECTAKSTELNQAIENYLDEIVPDNTMIIIAVMSSYTRIHITPFETTNLRTKKSA